MSHMETLDVIGWLLLLAGMLIALPAILAGAGPAHDHPGRVTSGWLRDERRRRLQ